MQTLFMCISHSVAGILFSSLSAVLNNRVQAWAVTPHRPSAALLRQAHLPPLGCRWSWTCSRRGLGTPQCCHLPLGQQRVPCPCLFFNIGIVVAAMTLLQCVILSMQDVKETGRFLGSERNVWLYSTNTEEESCPLCFPGQPTLSVISKDVPTSIITLAFKRSSSNLLGILFPAAACWWCLPCWSLTALAAAPSVLCPEAATCCRWWPWKCTGRLPTAVSGDLTSW